VSGCRNRTVRGIQQATIIVGNSSNAVVALWSSPAATINVPLSSTPGVASNQVVLACPPLIKAAAFSERIWSARSVGLIH